MPQKIVVFMTVMCCLACAAQAVEDEKFVNPLFAEILEPLSRGTWQTTLTPTKRAINNKLGTNREENCELLENTQTHIALKCRGIFAFETREVEHTYRYTLRPCRKENGCDYKASWLVEEKVFDAKGEWAGTATLYIE